MTPRLLTAFALCTALAASAQLMPGTEAQFLRHMQEVNKEWALMHPGLPEANRAVRFSSEAGRIATHLRLVRARLAATTPEGLSAGQAVHRAFLLDKLGTYADRGLFPQNHVLPYRNPVFIDPHGTACAVGQLIIESGRRDLAERISSGMNLAYVLDMPSSPLWPEMAAWADEHGFMAEELAWIQPAYPPVYPWIPLGGGTNGPVQVVKELGNGNLLIAGAFAEAGGTPANRVAVWNGTNYSALGGGVQGQVNCAVEFNGNIYLGGAMLNGMHDLAAWDGSSWSFSTVFDGKYPLINALHVHDNMLHAAGTMSGFAGNTEFVQRLNGPTWAPLGNTFDAPVLTLASHNGALIAGGAFTHGMNGGGPLPLMHVATFNDAEEWVQYADGLDASVRTLLDVNGTLYAGGDLYANIVPTFGLARIAQGSPHWEPLLPNHGNYMLSGPGPSWIGSLAEHNGGIYFGGSFTISPMLGTYGHNLGRFDGVPDNVQALIVLDAPVNAIAVKDQQVVIGGAFEAAYPHVAALDLSTGIKDPRASAFTLAPNPATDVLRITPSGADALSGPLTIFDAGGRTVAMPVERGNGSVTVDVRELPAGAYQVRIGDAGVQRFVKQ